MSYVPSPELLQKYAAVLVHFALNSGDGVKKGEVVQCAVPDVAKPLALALQTEILKAGANPIIRLLPTEFDAQFYEYASEDQIKFFPKEYFKARAELIDHQISIIADVNPRELSFVDPKKILLSRDSKKDYRDWLTQKETNGKFTWTIGLWGTQAKATEVGLSLEDYWKQIISACFLDEADPVAKWREVVKKNAAIKKALNDMQIEHVHMVGEDVDIVIKLGADRIWKGGEGRNIPSFEIFTSPDWRGTNGWIRFNQPLYRYGQVLKGVFLRFKDGVVVEAKANEGEEFLQQMIQSTNANKLGEYSLTDKRLSRITHVMAETLFDENMGGEFGNTHVALGMAYKDCYRGDASKLTQKEWEELGYNDSAEHTDIISTVNRTVTATDKDGNEVVIYKDGQFLVGE